jgi:membrane protein required for colicin V production
LIFTLADIAIQTAQAGKDVEGYFSSYIRVIDIILAFFICWGSWKGWQKGFLVELISTFTFIIGLVVVFSGITYLFVALDRSVVQSPKPVKFLFFFMAYIVGSFFLNKLSRVIQYKIDYSIFDSFDNFAAMLLGGFKYAVYLSILLGLLDAAGLKMSDNITKDTYVYPALLNLKDWLVDVGKVIAPVIGEIHQEILKMMKG